jgi:uncharacterized membrane protein YkoI
MSDMNKVSDQELESVSGGVTKDEALLKALAHAGLNVDPRSLKRKKIEMDYEHGVKVYEIKFHYNGMEYEYDIDAQNGNVLKFEKDWD